MDIQQMERKMALLAGEPMLVGEISIEPFTLKEIVKIGYSEIIQRLQILTLTVDDIVDSVDNFELQAILKAEKHKYKPFDLFMMSDGLTELVVESLKLFLRTDDVVILDNGIEDSVIVIDDKSEITRETFDEVIRVIKMQNDPVVSSEESDGEDEYLPVDDVARRIAEKLKRAKEIASQSKKVDGDSGVTIIDIISAVTGMSNSTNKINVWEYTLYQLYDEFARLNKIDNYRMQIQASMWSSDIEIQHWSEPL